jgi:hypothetical protein
MKASAAALRTVLMTFELLGYCYPRGLATGSQDQQPCSCDRSAIVKIRGKRRHVPIATPSRAALPLPG